jgi:crotonobetainyl-CoA:carnitine CoA-transferase CaiB-like acyl-CoA transferase
LVSVSGYEGGEPLKTGFSYGDPMAGTALVAAVAMAVRHRNRTGEGMYIELAQRENLTAFVGEYIVDYSMNGELRQPIGNRDPHAAPQGVYRCAGADSWIAIACRDDAEFVALCAAIERPDLAADPRFAAASGRKQAQPELDAVIGAWTAQRGHYEAMHILQRAGVTAGAALTIPELLSDPQLRARGAWAEHTHPDAGTWEMEEPPWRLGRTPGNASMPAPGFGAHNGYVLREVLGLGEAEIARLYAEGVTADDPDESLHL